MTTNTETEQVCSLCDQRSTNLMRPGDAANLVLENKRLKGFILDAAAFLRTNKWGANVVLSTLTHDIMGLANDERCFSPRVTGYHQREQERK